MTAGQDRLPPGSQNGIQTLNEGGIEFAGLFQVQVKPRQPIRALDLSPVNEHSLKQDGHVGRGGDQAQQGTEEGA